MSLRTRPAEPFTYADLERFPDDGYRRELVSGQMLVTPSPRLSHQVMAMGIYRLLRDTCPPGLMVIPAPYDWYVREDTVFVPDVMVLDRAEGDARREEGTPTLVAEVLSPSTASTDRTLKRHEFAAAGVPHYWLADPAGPSLTVLRLESGGAYGEVATVRIDQVVTLAEPWSLVLRPADLVVP